jgi:MOSC domain-containing protein YiiM
MTRCGRKPARRGAVLEGYPWPVPILDSVNLGRERRNPYKESKSTGIEKLPAAGRIGVRAPGPKTLGLGSGLVGDFIGDVEHHGGDGQAVYAFQREDLDAWQLRLGRSLPNGFFGENLTTRDLEVNEARLGERWQIGPEVVLEVTSPRIPCSTFRGWVEEKRWLKLFTAMARPGAYLSVVTPGTIAAGDEVEIVHRPDHEITIALAFRALTTDRDLLPRLLEAGEALDPELRDSVSGVS